MAFPFSSYTGQWRSLHFILIFSGFGQMPLYKRYMLDRLPGLSWVTNFSVTLSIHYWAAAVLILAITYHIVFHGIRRDFDMLPRKGDMKQSAQIIMAVFGFGKEPENDKYLAEQRLAYVFIGGSLLIMVFTGIIKVLKTCRISTFRRLYLLDHPDSQPGHFPGHHRNRSSPWRFIFKENWPMLPGIFTGKIDLDMQTKAQYLV